MHFTPENLNIKQIQILKEETDDTVMLGFLIPYFNNGYIIQVNIKKEILDLNCILNNGIVRYKIYLKKISAFRIHFLKCT